MSIETSPQDDAVSPAEGTDAPAPRNDAKDVSVENLTITGQGGSIKSGAANEPAETDSDDEGASPHNRTITGQVGGSI